jgi:hypothetical protein
MVGYTLFIMVDKFLKRGANLVVVKVILRSDKINKNKNVVVKVILRSDKISKNKNSIWLRVKVVFLMY